MRILAIERELPFPHHPHVQDLLRDEAARVWTLLKRDIVREIWFTASDRRAVVMLECSSAAEARQHLATLPLVRHGQIDFTLLELRPYDGLERLFAEALQPVAARAEPPPEY